MDTHALKIWPGFYDAVASGEKPFEVRKNDRDYKVGDRLVLREWDPTKEAYSNRPRMHRVVTCVLDRPDFVLRGYVIMGIRPLTTDEVMG